MAILFFDTETTGLPNKYAGLQDEGQPHIVQIAAVLCSEKLIPIISLNALVKADNWEVSEFVQKLTGITNEKLEEQGIAEKSALRLFYDMYRHSRMIVAHNIYFDKQIISIAGARYGVTFPEKEMFCTMAESKDILQIPPTEKMVNAGIDSFKNPNLTECIKFFFNEELEGAHDAMNDVNACIKIFKKIKDMEASL